MDLLHGVLIDIVTRDPTLELISLAERETSYPVEKEEEVEEEEEEEEEEEKEVIMLTMLRKSIIMTKIVLHNNST